MFNYINLIDYFQNDLDRAAILESKGHELIASKHYAVDCIEPKCIELSRMCTQWEERWKRRSDSLIKERNLQDRIEKVGYPKSMKITT